MSGSNSWSRTPAWRQFDQPFHRKWHGDASLDGSIVNWISNSSSTWSHCRNFPDPLFLSHQLQCFLSQWRSTIVVLVEFRIPPAGVSTPLLTRFGRFIRDSKCPLYLKSSSNILCAYILWTNYMNKVVTCWDFFSPESIWRKVSQITDLRWPQNCAPWHSRVSWSLPRTSKSAKFNTSSYHSRCKIGSVSVVGCRWYLSDTKKYLLGI